MKSKLENGQHMKMVQVKNAFRKRKKKSTYSKQATIGMQMNDFQDLKKAYENQLEFCQQRFLQMSENKKEYLKI